MSEEPYATILHMEGGQSVRVCESIGEASERLPDAERADGWAPFTDPGDGRAKLVRAARVLWVEQEPDAY